MRKIGFLLAIIIILGLAVWAFAVYGALVFFTHKPAVLYPTEVEYKEGMTLMPGQSTTVTTYIDFEPTFDDLLDANVSAYCPCEKCCGVYADGITASGHKIKTGDKFVAAPPEYPFGTMMDIPGYGKVPVLDRGGAIKGNKLDVFFSTHQEALNWGRRYLKVKIVKARMAKQ